MMDTIRGIVLAIIVGPIFLAFDAYQWIRYWLHLGPKPTPEDFS